MLPANLRWRETQFLEAVWITGVIAAERNGELLRQLAYDRRQTIAIFVRRKRALFGFVLDRTGVGEPAFKDWMPAQALPNLIGASAIQGFPGCRYAVLRGHLGQLSRMCSFMLIIDRKFT